MVHPFPDFPLDIARKIFETAAVHDRDNACRLVRVSKAVHTWIEPLIYRDIVIDTSIEARRLAHAFSSRDRNSARTFNPQAVRQLCVYYGTNYDDEDLSTLLEIALDADSIMWWCRTTALLSYIDKLRPKYFSFADLTLGTVDSLLPRSITHLSVIFHARDPSLTDRLRPKSYDALWRNVFARCPFLTHIMLGFYVVDPPPWASHKMAFVQSVLSNAPSAFKALIIELKTSGGLADGSPLGWNVSDFGACLEDPRFIIVSPEPWYADVEGVACYPTGLDWNYWAYMRGRDLWEFADAQLRGRASATLPGS